ADTTSHYWVKRGESVSAKHLAEELWAKTKIYPVAMQFDGTGIGGNIYEQLVNVPIWVSAANRSEEAFGPKVETSAGGEITLTARVEKITINWDDQKAKDKYPSDIDYYKAIEKNQMSDNKTIQTCMAHQLATPYVKTTAYPDGPQTTRSPSCGHYFRTKGQSTVHVTTTWIGEWQGLGESGVLTQDVEWDSPTFNVYEYTTRIAE
ncbi:MAG: hypothetical protein LBR21_03515, partial [Propionibacteriaceae bacterium]|nr:hypothetical protein [Propionibacteriaceae bacterium]